MKGRTMSQGIQPSLSLYLSLSPYKCTIKPQWDAISHPANWPRLTNESIGDDKVKQKGLFIALVSYCSCSELSHT